MANFANIKVTFNGSPFLGGNTLVIKMNVNGTDYFIEEAPVSLRTGVKKFTSYSLTDPDAIEKTTPELAFAINSDYRGSALVQSLPISPVLSNVDSVIITANVYGVTFSVANVPSWADILITPEVMPVDFEITSVTAQAADTADRNTHVRYNVSVANGIAPYDISSPVTKLNQNEPLFFDYLRNSPLPGLQVSIEDDNSDVANYTLPTVDVWTLDSITVNESTSGATVIANVSTTTGTISATKEYSLDNINWQFGASFIGIAPGNYTMYVRDNYGASQTELFEVVGVSPEKPEPYFEIVNSNGLRFVPDSTFDCDTIPNWDNALFQQILDEQFPNVERRYYNQLISDCDIIDTQIRTNYDNVVVSIYDCDDNLVLNPTAEIKKTNILQKDKRDCALKQVESGDNVGKTFLYFTGGDIYEPDTTNITGKYTNSTKGVFPFAKLGSLFTIIGTSGLNGDYSQLGVEFDITSGYYGLVIDVAFSGATVQTAIVQTIYNKKVYNIWEFSTVGTALANDKIYRIEIDATDDDVRYTDIKWLSEPIYKLNSTRNTVKFVASNGAENTANIDFTTGIELTMRLPGRYIVALPEETTSDFETQQGIKRILKTTITRNIPFESSLVPYYIVEKLSILSGLDKLVINNIPSVKGDDAENTPRADDNNPLYLIKRNYQQYNSVDISDTIGLVTESPEVIGESDTIVIGT